MPLSKSYIAELNGDIAYQEYMFRRGRISYEEYEAERGRLIKEYYMKYYDDDMNCLLDYENEREPSGLLGAILGLISKMF